MRKGLPRQSTCKRWRLRDATRTAFARSRLCPPRNKGERRHSPCGVSLIGAHGAVVQGSDNRMLIEPPLLRPSVEASRLLLIWAHSPRLFQGGEYRRSRQWSFQTETLPSFRYSFPRLNCKARNYHADEVS